MRKRLIIVSFAFAMLLIGASQLHAQHHYLQGYIITYANDTLNGMIRNQQQDENYRICYFKENEVETSYSPEDIKGYGTLFGLRYTSQVLEGIFVEVLEKGDISLYRHKDRFLLEKQGELVEIGEDAGKTLGQDSWSGRSEDRYQWKQDLSNLIKDRLTDHTEILLDFTPNDRSLSSLVSRYNGSTASLYDLFQGNKPKVRFKYGLVFGASRASILSAGEYSGYNNQDYFEQADFTTNGPMLGVIALVDFPRWTEKVAIQGELHYMQLNYAAQLRNTTGVYYIQYDDLFMDFEKIALPLSVKFSFPFGKMFQFALQGGVNFEYNMNFESRRMTEEVISDMVKIHTEHQIINEVNEYQAGLWGGCELSRTFGQFSGGVAFRYYKMPNLYKENELNLSTNRMSIHLIVTKL
jgi:hypothetical protein